MRYRQKNYKCNHSGKKFALPHIWLMTDPRMGGALLPAIQRLPAKSGIIFRHYDLPEKERRKLFSRIARICARRGHVIIMGGGWVQAVKWRSHGAAIAGVHIPGHAVSAIKGRTPRHMLFSMGVHNIAELGRARNFQADMIFVSPVFSTASHPDRRSIGVTRYSVFAKMARDIAVIALGGMDGRRIKSADGRATHGWAGIDAFMV